MHSNGATTIIVDDGNIDNKSDLKGDQESDNDSGFERTSNCSSDLLEEDLIRINDGDDEDDDDNYDEENDDDEKTTKEEIEGKGSKREEERKNVGIRLKEKMSKLMATMFGNEEMLKRVNSMKIKDARQYFKRIFGKLLDDYDDDEIDSMILSFRPTNSDESIVLPPPEWLDMDKFRRGQKFGLDHISNIFYSQLYGLLVLFSFTEDAKALILTRRSHTPYLSFKRYLQTGLIVRDWFTDDPWTEGTNAYKNILLVRKMHSMVSKQMENLDRQELDKICDDILGDGLMCPTIGTISRDLMNASRSSSKKICVYELAYNPLRKSNGLNQAGMSNTLFGFMGIVVLFPERFGLFNVTDDELESFCHFWRAIGYLLGVEEESNFCRGSLSEVRERCRKFVDQLIKPNLKNVTAQWEHMMRCTVEGTRYYFMTPNFEDLMLILGKMFDIPMPHLYASMSFPQRIAHRFFEFVSVHINRIPGIQILGNAILNYFLDKARLYDKDKHEELKKRSIDWMSNTFQRS